MALVPLLALVTLVALVPRPSLAWSTPPAAAAEGHCQLAGVYCADVLSLCKGGCQEVDRECEAGCRLAQGLCLERCGRGPQGQACRTACQDRGGRCLEGCGPDCRTQCRGSWSRCLDDPLVSCGGQASCELTCPDAEARCREDATATRDACLAGCPTPAQVGAQREACRLACPAGKAGASCREACTRRHPDFLATACSLDCQQRWRSAQRGCPAAADACRRACGAPLSGCLDERQQCLDGAWADQQACDAQCRQRRLPAAGRAACRRQCVLTRLTARADCRQLFLGCVEGWIHDADGDGQTRYQGDCDEGDPTIWRGAPELCDGKDNDCVGGPASDEVDDDGDGVGECQDVCPGVFDPEQLDRDRDGRGDGCTPRVQAWALASPVVLLGAGERAELALEVAAWPGVEVVATVSWGDGTTDTSSFLEGGRAVLRHGYGVAGPYALEAAVCVPGEPADCTSWSLGTLRVLEDDSEVPETLFASDEEGALAAEAAATLRGLGLALLRSEGKVHEGLDPLLDLQPVAVSTDETGTGHVRVQQFASGIPVFGAEAIVHVRADGSLAEVTDALVDEVAVDPVPAIPAADAILLARALDDCATCPLAAPPEASLVVYPSPEGDHRLAWKVFLPYAGGLFDQPSKPVVLVDAHRAEVLLVYDRVMAGSGTGIYSGAVAFDSVYHEENFRGPGYETADLVDGYITLRMQNDGSLTWPYDADDDWDNEQKTNARLVEAHYNMGLVVDYYDSVHYRRGMDGMGGPKKCNSNADRDRSLMCATIDYVYGPVTRNGRDYYYRVDNAYYDDGNIYLGSGVDNGPYVGLDTIAHEFTHGVSDTSAGLIYEGESGALAEHLSDAFAAAVEAHYGGDFEHVWWHGERHNTPDIAGDAGRYLDDPTRNGSPDHYADRLRLADGELPDLEENDLGYVHANGNIGNKVFFLAAMGGAHPRSPDRPMAGIGISRAARIWYRALDKYTTSRETYLQFRQATLAAAYALHGGGSAEFAAVASAWNLCGVGDGPVFTDAQELVANPGFEEVLEPWESQFDATYVAMGRHGHDGEGYVTLGGADDESGGISQTIVVPADRQRAELTFWLKITTTETTLTQVKDWVALFVRDLGTGRLTQLARYSNLSGLGEQASAYALKGPFDLLPWAGRSIELQFLYFTNGSNPTTFRIDSVSTAGASVVAQDVDNDGDGHTPGQGDCDDEDPTVHPGATEVCDGVDGNCDGTADGASLCDDGNGCTKDVCDGRNGCLHQRLPEGRACEDGNRCTTGDRCQLGRCLPGLDTLDCDDDDWCTVDSCDAREGCQHEPRLCDDKTACTSDTCHPVLGCQHIPVICPDDEDPCTVERCDRVLGCVRDPLDCDDDSACTIDSCSSWAGGCQHLLGLFCQNDGNPCTVERCDPETGCSREPANCDDLDPCTADDCDIHTGCTHTPRCPDDGDRCTRDVCETAFGLFVGCSHPPVGCDDLQPCTADTCDPATGGCVHTPRCPDDGDRCTRDVCEVVLGEFAGCSHPPITCDDGTVCTTDTCDPRDGTCSHEFVCDDDDRCTQDFCTVMVGFPSCSHRAVDCDDHDSCTADTCDPVTGCRHVRFGDGTDCDDDDPCTTGESCTQGVCGGGAPVVCDDEDVCTADFCDPVLGCQSKTLTDGTGCNDGDACTGKETCQQGQCIGMEIDCDDHNDCTTDTCDHVLGCQHKSLKDGTVCDDHDLCTLKDVCERGLCVSGAAQECDDFTECTIDTCDPEIGCVSTTAPDWSDCHDGNACTGKDKCHGGICSGIAIPCDDGDDCTLDGCDPATGCTVTTAPDLTTCNDHDACTGKDTCHDGVCWGIAVPCDDEESCTTDGCDSATGCTHTPLADGEPCDDDDLCTKGEACQGGSCTGGAPRNCNDGEACTTDGCDPALGCTVTPVLVGTTCDDGDACTMGDSCNAAGRCAGSPRDEDGDTHVAEACGGDDCDDSRPAVHPGATEGPAGDATCSDGLDNDCDEAVDEQDPDCQDLACTEDGDCDDGDPCNGEELCLGQSCLPGVPLSCDDGDPVTADRCRPGAGCAAELRCELQLLGQRPTGSVPVTGSYFLDLSANGRYLAFLSPDPDLGDVPGPAGWLSTVYRRDRLLGTTVNVSVSLEGGAADGDSRSCSISGDGRFVAFASLASNLVATPANGQTQIFVRDLQTGTTVLASVGAAGDPANAYCTEPQISADGTAVVFTSSATNLVAGQQFGHTHFFVRDLVAGTTARVSVATDGTLANAQSLGAAAISADGRYVAFRSEARNLVADDTTANFDVFVRDRQASTTERVSLGAGGLQADGTAYGRPAISGDGRYVAFASSATNLVPPDTSQVDIFVRDRVAGTIARVSLHTTGEAPDKECSQPSISADGRFVAFLSRATNLDALLADTNGVMDAFVRDRLRRETWRVSLPPGGPQGNDRVEGWQEYAVELSDDGRFVGFLSLAGNLVPGDDNGTTDAFWRTNPGLACDDGDPCTADLCAGGGGCSHQPLGDGDPCSLLDPCLEDCTCTAGSCGGCTSVCP